jgi:hypothetical protein
MFRYAKAFWRVLKATVTGQEAIPHLSLRFWVEPIPGLVDAVHEAADQANVNQDAVTIRVDGREQSMKTILDAVTYHARQEYPYILRHLTEHSVTAIYASNMNDQYAVSRLNEHPSLEHPALKIAVDELHQQLQSIPPSES